MSVLPSLTRDDFSPVFRAIHHVDPYAWQCRLLEHVCASGRWPPVIAAPTGTGKTAVLDIALFHLALEAGAAPRRAPMRIVLAVDRRVIVDQAYERAQRIAKALERTSDGPVAALARRLASFSGNRPVHVAELRGGMPLEREWARRVDQPTILCTTVDQLGSRLLFRGYGVSRAMAPVHAGLLGADALLILDEAHLSRAFTETLSAIEKSRCAPEAPALPWAWIALTATPRTADDAFTLNDAERAEGAIARRLAARKRVALLKCDGEPRPRPFVDEAKRLGHDLTDRGEAAPVVAVVVNRVPLARAVFTALRDELGAAVDVLLLTGRVRPISRDRLIAERRSQLEGRQRGTRPLFVVATQCIEAGADFDFDAMVSQIAPLDALRQRFGRLARAGNRGDAAAPGAIIVHAAELKANARDPIYDRAAAKTWEWLQKEAHRERNAQVVDFGPDALDARLDGPSAATECNAPAAPAPPLRAADLQALAMTAPRPQPDPEPELFLHGERRDTAEVSLVWRADIEDLYARATSGDEDAVQALADLLALLPPRPSEALRLPLWQARSWLASGQSPPAANGLLADVPALSSEAVVPVGGERVLRWRGRDAAKLVAPAEIGPGDVVVLPASRGGCDAFGWAPDCTDPVEDLADLAAAAYRGWTAVLRLHPAVWPPADASLTAAPWSEVTDALEAGAGAGEIVKLTGVPGWQGARGLRLVQLYGPELGAGVVLVASGGLPGTDAAGEPSTEDDAGLIAREPVPLSLHAAAVARFASRQAAALGLAPALASTLERAASWHDDGKADPRFQLWLTSIEGRPGVGEPIAKTSVCLPRSRTRSLRAYAGLPARWRHEVASVRLAAARLITGGDPGGADPDLALWLIGSHHGHGRPFFEHDDDWDAYPQTLLGHALPAAPGPDKLDFDWQGQDWPGLMARLQARFGLWGLAFLEACLRLSDHRASAGEEP